MNNLLIEAIKKVLELIANIDNRCSNMQGATTTKSGKAGLAPAPPAGAANRALMADGTWRAPYNITSFDVDVNASSWGEQNDVYIYNIPSIFSTDAMISLALKYPIAETALKKLSIINVKHEADKITLVSSRKPDTDITITIHAYEEE